MNYRELKRAKIGDRVAFKPLPGDAGEYAEGTITDFSPSKNKCAVTWDDGESSQVTDASYDRIHLIEQPLTADLSQATAVTINALREQFRRGALKQGETATDRRPQPPNKGRRP